MIVFLALFALYAQGVVVSNGAGVARTSPRTPLVALEAVQAIAAPQDGFCSICEAIVGFVESYVEQNATIAQIEARLDAACALTGPFASECTALVDQYLPQIIQWVEKNETPADVCAKLGVCNNQVFAALAKVILANKAPQDGFCSICTAIVGFVESYVEQNSTEAQIQAQLDALCALTGPYASQCTALVDAYLPQIIAWIEKNETPADVCAKLGVCNNVLVTPTVVPAVAAAVAVGDQLGCTICKTIVGYVEIYVAQNATEQQIEKALHKICAVVKPVEMICDTLVDNELPKIIADVEKKESPAVICQKVKLCDNTTTTTTTAAAAVVVAAAVPAVQAPQDGFCSICEAIVGFVESYIEQNATEAQIQARLDAACALTGPYASECQALVDQYLPQIIAWIEKNETPADVCAKLGVCNDAVAIAAVQTSNGCKLCMTLAAYVEMFVANNATEAQIAAKLKKLCAAAGPLQPVCESLVDNELPTIIANLEMKESPTVVCDQLNVCDNSTANALAAAVAVVQAPQDGFCSVCTAIVGFVESYVEQNSTEAQIQAQLDALCALAGPYASQCTALVDAYLPQIIAWVEKNETPADVCAKLGVCNALNVEAKQALARALTIAADAELCAVCEGIVALGDHYVANNQSVTFIASELTKICALTGQYETVCDDFVQQYSADIAQYVARKATPAEVCDAFKLCDSRKK